MQRQPGLLKAAAATAAGSHPRRRQLRAHARGSAPPRTRQPLGGQTPSRHRPAAPTLPDWPPPPITSLRLSDWRRGVAPGTHPNKSTSYWPGCIQWRAALRPGGGGCVFPEDVAARARAASPWLSSGLGFAAWAPRHRGPRRRRHDLPHGHAE